MKITAFNTDAQEPRPAPLQSVVAKRNKVMREFAFERMVERGMADSRSGRVISNEDIERMMFTNALSRSCGRP